MVVFISSIKLFQQFYTRCCCLFFILWDFVHFSCCGILSCGILSCGILSLGILSCGILSCGILTRIRPSHLQTQTATPVLQTVQPAFQSVLSVLRFLLPLQLLILGGCLTCSKLFLPVIIALYLQVFRPVSTFQSLLPHPFWYSK